MKAIKPIVSRITKISLKETLRNSLNKNFNSLSNVIHLHQLQFINDINSRKDEQSGENIF